MPTIKLEVDHKFIKNIMRDMTLLCWAVKLLNLITLGLIRKRLTHEIDKLIEQVAEAIAEIDKLIEQVAEAIAESVQVIDIEE